VDLFLPSRGPVDFRHPPNGRSLALDALIVAQCEARKTLGSILLVEVM
jgi:hypothetical protein